MLEDIKKAIDILDKVDDYYYDLPNKQSEIDFKISDIYHYIETHNIDSEKAYRLIKELKANLIERRNLKNEQIILQLYYNNKHMIMNKSNRAIMLNSLCKRNKDLNSEYKYRIYNKDEFENMIEK